MADTWTCEGGGFGHLGVVLPGDQDLRRRTVRAHPRGEHLAVEPAGAQDLTIYSPYWHRG